MKRWASFWRLKFRNIKLNFTLFIQLWWFIFQAERLRPVWHENLLYIIKCYIGKNDYQNARIWMQKANDLDPLCVDVILLCFGFFIENHLFILINLFKDVAAKKEIDQLGSTVLKNWIIMLPFLICFKKIFVYFIRMLLNILRNIFYHSLFYNFFINQDVWDNFASHF